MPKKINYRSIKPSQNDKENLRYCDCDTLDFFGRIATLSISEMELCDLNRADWYYLRRICKQTKNCKLSERESQVVYLYFWKHFTYPEIAKVLKCNNSTPQSFMSRARKKIATALNRPDLCEHLRVF